MRETVKKRPALALAPDHLMKMFFDNLCASQFRDLFVTCQSILDVYDGWNDDYQRSVYR